MITQIYEILINKDHKGTAFFSGDIMATWVSLSISPHIDFFSPFAKLGMALLLGVFGGFGGLIAKDLYELYLKKNFIHLKHKWNSRKHKK